MKDGQSDVELRQDVKVQSDFGDLLRATAHPIECIDSRLYWKPKRIVQWLRCCQGVDLNDMGAAYSHGEFPLDEYKQFYRDMGYSLDGFVEIFHQ